MIDTSDSPCEKESAWKYFEEFSSFLPVTSAARRPFTPTFGGILGHFFIALNPVLDKGLFFGTRGSAPSCHTWTERSLFYHFFIKVSSFAIPAPRVRHNNTALRQDEPTLAFPSVRLSAASRLRLLFFFFSHRVKKKRWLSRLPVSQRQAGLGVPSRSDRSLITATVSQEEEREGKGSAGVRGERRREEVRAGARRED